MGTENTGLGVVWEAELTRSDVRMDAGRERRGPGLAQDFGWGQGE